MSEWKEGTGEEWKSESEGDLTSPWFAASPIKHYILDGEIILEATFMEWCDFVSDISRRRLAYDKFDDKSWVSTVFLGLDHNFSGETKVPLLFETMAWYKNSDYEFDCRRYSSYEEALTGHREILEQLKIAIFNNL